MLMDWKNIQSFRYAGMMRWLTATGLPINISVIYSRGIVSVCQARLNGKKLREAQMVASGPGEMILNLNAVIPEMVSSAE